MPHWLLAATYVAIGWTIGLKFDRAILLHAARALPQIMLSIFILMGFCGAIAWLLSHQLGIDPLTAYLATSPGGMDSVAIIAAASANVDLSFVMALQTAASSLCSCSGQRWQGSSPAPCRNDAATLRRPHSVLTCEHTCLSGAAPVSGPP